MRVAIADVGTNSSHLIIAEFDRDAILSAPRYQIVDSLRDQTRLGEHLEDGRLSEEGYERLRLAMERIRDLAAANRVTDTLVYATSALREASNGRAVVERIRADTQVPIEIISGEREGELTYLGAAGSLPFHGPTLLLDLGGGSLELVKGSSDQVERAISLPVGVVRLRDSFLLRDPPSKKMRGALQEHLAQAVSPHLSGLMADDPKLIGSSGTFESLASMLAERKGLAIRSVNGFRIERQALAQLTSQLGRMPLSRRLRLAGLDPKRADIIIAGSEIALKLLELSGRSEVTVSTGALREGMLIDYLRSQVKQVSSLSSRELGVLELAERLQVDLAHGQRVAALASQLLERLRPFHPFPEDAGELLAAAAALHEAGLIISPRAHHKHSLYLIQHAGLRGFSHDQVDLIANVARYHRRGTPKSSHPAFAALDKGSQELVGKLSAILRVADGLDRSHQQSAHLVQLLPEEGGYQLILEGGSDLDIWGAEEKSDLWKKYFGALRIVRLGD
jgi:exopolyphosphatase/guanosine-5'-triphosphate,3'-diphosphate pyrophosphatase